MVAKGDIIPDLAIKECQYKGFGVGFWKDKIIRVPYSAPGDIIEAQIEKKKKRILTGSIKKILSPSPYRTKAPCPYFERCGGCCWQHIELRKQQEIKKAIFKQALNQYLPENLQEIKIQSSPQSWRYRNKMEYTFGVDDNNSLIIGQHYPNNYQDIVSIESCRIQPEVFDQVLACIKNFFKGLQYTPWSSVTHEGFLRQLVIRMGYKTGEVMVCLLTTPQQFPEVEALSQRLFEEIPGMKSFYWGVSSLLADIFFMEEVCRQWGEKVIQERIGDKQYRISPHSFFQTNTSAAENLFKTIQEYANLDGQQNILDAYCGTGSIGLFLAEKARHVWGIEVIQDAVFMARENALLNNISNTTFMQGEVRIILPRFREFFHRNIDVVIIDPPRAGMHKKALKNLLSLNAHRLVYVSCNPLTLARDLEKIVESGYTVTQGSIFDFCPHTYHIESCLLLTKRK